MQNFVPQYLEAAMDAFQRNQSAVRDAFSGNMLRRPGQAQHGDVRGARRRPSPRKRKARTTKPSDQRSRRACAPSSPRSRPKSTSWAADAACDFALLRRSRCSLPHRSLTAQTAIRRRSWHRDASRRQLVLFGAAGRERSEFHRREFRSRSSRSTARARRGSVSISKPATAAAPFLSVWTSDMTRNVPATFNPATATVSAATDAYDPLLDALAFSRGRIAVSVSGGSRRWWCRRGPKLRGSSRIAAPELPIAKRKRIAEYSHHYKSCVRANKNSSSSRLQRSERR